MKRRLKRSKNPPSVIALAGPNGAGKSTAGPALVRDALGVTQFVDADQIARGLAAFEPERVAVPAGRIMLRRLKEMARNRESFAFETTLASRSFAPWIAGLVRSGYQFHLVFLWLRSADLAVERVRDRIRLGGHAVPEDVIRRRYRSGLLNFFRLYLRLATSWRMYDNSLGAPRLIAAGQGRTATVVSDRATWDRVSGMNSDA
jgi:predicted ABC-type ATPase